MQNRFKNVVPVLLLLIAGCSPGKNMIAEKDTLTAPVFDKQGHRGCRGLMPENTIPAMLKAIELGVTTLEMDVVFTKDKVAILSHEPFFNHDITTAPGGQFITQKEERTFNIFQLTLAETRQYDVGLKPHPRFPRQQKIKVSKPALAELIDSVETHLSTHQLTKVSYNIETKTTPFTDNIYHPAPAEFVRLLMEVINSKGIADRVIIQSFDFRTLQVLHASYPTIKTAMLIEDYDKRTLDEQLKSLGFKPAIYSPAHTLVNKALVDACHAMQVKVIPWTVNDRNTILQLKQLGVDGIISDYPDLMND